MINWFEHLYPYTNVHELNLDWIIQTVKELSDKINLKYDDVLKEFIMEHFNTLFAGLSYVEETHTLKMYLGVVGDGVHVFTPGDETMTII